MRIWLIFPHVINSASYFPTLQIDTFYLGARAGVPLWGRGVYKYSQVILLFNSLSQ